MKTGYFKIFILLYILFGFLACTKETPGLNTTSSHTDLSVRADSIKIPLTDMGTQTYLGFTGGLYAGGSNIAPGTYASDLVLFANNIVPKDSSGRNVANGKVGFISLGASTGGNMMKALISKTRNNPLTNPSLYMVNCNNGYHTAAINDMMNPADPYWGFVNDRLVTTRLSYKQVQVIYLETDDSILTNDFPARPYRTRDEYEVALRLFKKKFPNLRLVYVLGRTTTFVTKGILTNVEPCPYYNGWACKFVIEDQINGKTGTKYKGVGAVAPMIAWGWYQWAYGTSQPRNDGFTWEKTDTKDGLHGTDIGVDTLSTYFQRFLLTDNAAKLWYGRK